jgi:hypothetical protein
MASDVLPRIICTFRKSLVAWLVPVSFAAVLLWPAPAAGAIWVWWTFEGGDGEVVGSGKGQTLEVIPTAGDFAHQYTFSMWICTDSSISTRGCMGYHNNLWHGPDRDMSIVSDPMEGLLNPLGWTGPAGCDGTNEGDFLIRNFGRSCGSGEGGISYSVKVFTVTLEITGEAAPHYVYQTVGASLYQYDPPTQNYVSFGPNPLVSGSTAVIDWSAASLTLPVIAIIPEPAALALLGFGLLALTRRRA